jgi:carbonic anhydrase
MLPCLFTFDIIQYHSTYKKRIAALWDCRGYEVTFINHTLDIQATGEKIQYERLSWASETVFFHAPFSGHLLYLETFGM